MHYFIKVLLLITLSLSFLVNAACPSPEETATSFFVKHKDFFAQDPKPVELLVTTDFYKLLVKSWECANKNQGLCIYENPWTGTNSIELQVPVSVQSQKISESLSKVKLVFESKNDSIVGSYSIEDFLILKRENGSCWKIADLITPKGTSITKAVDVEN